MESASVWKGIGYGAIASMLGDVVTMPIDVCKTRLQLSGEGGRALYSGVIDCLTRTARGEGVRALWSGLEPALWRQASYGSLRYGLYGPLKDIVAPGVPKNELTLAPKIVAGAASGTLAQGFANPCDLVKIKMIGAGIKGGGSSGATSGAATTLPRWFIPAFVQIARSKGVSGLYRGLGPNVARASTLAAAELATYDSLKPLVQAHSGLRDGLPTHVVTALCSGFVSAIVGNPFDVVKSRVMNGAGKNTGIVQCIARIVQEEGVAALWKGFLPAYARIGPRVVIAFVVMEKLRDRFG